MQLYIILGAHTHIVKMMLIPGTNGFCTAAIYDGIESKCIMFILKQLVVNVQLDYLMQIDTDSSVVKRNRIYLLHPNILNHYSINYSRTFS